MVFEGTIEKKVKHVNCYWFPLFTVVEECYQVTSPRNQCFSCKDMHIVLCPILKILCLLLAFKESSDWTLLSFCDIHCIGGLFMISCNTIPWYHK